jgi:hypothetical protein
MAVNRACYCSRQDVMSAPDITFTADMTRHVDSALEAGADEADRVTRRRFWNAIETNYWDWPNYTGAYPWRIWLDAKEIADKDGSGYLATAPVVTTGVQSSSPVTIPNDNLFWQPRNYGPPYRGVELSRASSFSFGLSDTPQEDVSILAVFGYWMATRPGGTVAANVNSSVTAVTVSDGSVAGPGDVLVAGTEQLLVRDAGMADTGQQQTGSGCSTTSAGDCLLTVADGTQLHAGEILQLDSEWMLALSVTGNVATVQRAYSGTQIATHSDAEVYAQRALTVARGFGGTTAASHTASATLLACLIPGMVREYAIAEALNYVFQKTSGYARTIGENGATAVPGGSLPDLRNRVWEQYGRRVRQRVV